MTLTENLGARDQLVSLLPISTAPARTPIHHSAQALLWDAGRRTGGAWPSQSSIMINMSPQTKELIRQIEALTPEPQEAVRSFIDHLKQVKNSAFLSTVDEFMEKHPELLTRLAE
ncbi:MAG: hypothetical protein ACR2L2_09780 [Acidobacteriota bacterium]